MEISCVAFIDDNQSSSMARLPGIVAGDFKRFLLEIRIRSSIGVIKNGSEKDSKECLSFPCYEALDEARFAVRYEVRFWCCYWGVRTYIDINLSVLECEFQERVRKQFRTCDEKDRLEKDEK